MKLLGAGISSFSDSKVPSGPVGHDVIPEEAEKDPILMTIVW